MDLWVVAAATGAGYVAKYWKNLLSKEGETSSQSFSLYRQSESSNLLKQIWDQSTPLQRLALNQLDRTGFLMDEKDFTGAVTSTTSDFDNTHEKYNIVSLTSFPPGSYENESSQRKGKSKYFSDISMRLGSKYNGNFLEPLDSLETCLEAQLCREYATMEEYVYSSLPSPELRPLLVTDGNQLESREYRLQSQVGFDENERQLLTRNTKDDIRKGSRRLSTMRDSGFPNGEVSFVLGISIGVMFTILANKREVKNLNKVLNERERLVQDLEEELEMKEELNVKELADEDFESWRRNEIALLGGTSNAINHEQDSGKSEEFGNEELDHHNNKAERPEEMSKIEQDSGKSTEFGNEELDHHNKKAERSEEMSKIEAELEAELERLELNMSTSFSLQRISLGVELEPDFVPDVAHGDLKLDKATGKPCGFSDSNQDASGTSTDLPDDAGNYAVSPRELSLRLHEVIESRLKVRIIELETALENSQNKLETLEMESTIHWRDLYNEA
ncbi:hypothetical protein Ddye_030844 [Dipteronia dyeriana]|uniref:Uncharacterized protein n=1 Tax=Dipteronia dyeriana TaxID=168575 RepID=A0AAD9TH83_9ROSI|nr:hypothetical protein Ddye_030844 [Dipteronia dyeriana]